MNRLQRKARARVHLMEMKRQRAIAAELGEEVYVKPFRPHAAGRSIVRRVLRAKDELFLHKKSASLARKLDQREKAVAINTLFEVAKEQEEKRKKHTKQPDADGWIDQRSVSAA